MEWDLLSPEREFIGFENYITAVSDPTLQKVFGNTFAYVFVCVPLMVVISLVLALMLNQIEKGRSFFRLIVFIPYVTSAVAISYVWKWMFMKNGGVINGILKFFGIAPQPFLNSADQSIFVVMSNVIWSSIGFNTIILLAGLMQIPRTYYEAAEIDGASGWEKFRYITNPPVKSHFSLCYRHGYDSHPAGVYTGLQHRRRGRWPPEIHGQHCNRDLPYGVPPVQNGVGQRDHCHFVHCHYDYYLSPNESFE